MRFDIITLFPELFTPFTEVGVTRRAYASGLMRLKLWHLYSPYTIYLHRSDFLVEVLFSKMQMCSVVYNPYKQKILKPIPLVKFRILRHIP